MAATDDRFRVALTADFFDADGSPKFADMGLDVLARDPNIAFEPFKEHRPQIGADQLEGFNAAIVLTPAVTAQSLARSDDFLAIGRFGVGYDAVDVEACNNAGVLLFITAGAVDRSVAEATVGWMIALTHHLRVKDRLVREGAWNERTQYMGCELRDRTFGAVGLGGIARATLRLLASFDMREPIAFDPFVDGRKAAELGVRLVPLDELMQEADFVSIHCPLSEKTRGLIGPAQLKRMKRDAYLINTARGGIVDEDALFEALRERRIAGAALDCFADEPVTKPHRFGELENVLLAPHAIAWTGELFRDIGRAVCGGMVDLACGRPPRGIVNTSLLDAPAFRRKWQRLSAGRCG